MNNDELRKFIIKADQTIREAMETINANWREVALVEDANRQIVGLITDGDIRRGLLCGLTLASPVIKIIKKDYIFVGPEEDRAAVLDLMKALSIRHIPIIDQQKRLIGIHFLQDLIGTPIKPNIAVIMAGGKGTRLMPLTQNYPKPMIKVAGRPILERLILHLVGFGIQKIYISINYCGEIIEGYFGNGSALGCSIEYLKENEALGTGGALSLLPECPKHPFIVMNGDLVTQANINGLLEFHQRIKAAATITSRTYQMEIPYGIIETAENRLVQLQEKPLIHYLINAGIYVFNPKVISLVPRNQYFPITRLFEALLEKKDIVGVYVLNEEWIDVGIHQELQRANGIIR
ncbi:MAG TPA: alcohol dehydrogenase [Firmicutes bacterium]|jgi:dTDP-glucose pyrophosphorylase|nr:alcohol dehydrogenase [Bacillota bacterium]